MTFSVFDYYLDLNREVARLWLASSPGRAASSVCSRDEAGNPYSTNMEGQGGHGASEARSIEQIHLILQSANRLIWPDGFQASTIKATHTLHFGVRHLLQRRAITETIGKLRATAMLQRRLLQCGLAATKGLVENFPSSWIVFPI